MNIDLIILLLASVTNFIVGAFVLATNIRSRVNLTFFMFTLTTILWAVGNYIADHAASSEAADLFTRLTFMAGGLIGLSMVGFSLVFPTDRLTPRKTWVLIGATVLVSLFSLSSLVTQSVLRHTSGVGVELATGPLYVVYILIIVGLIGYALRNLFRGYSKVSPLRRTQIKIIAAGFAMGTLFGVTTNLILPILLNDWSSSRFGSIAIVILVAAVAYAIVRHRFLDIRLLVTRSIAYVFVLATLALVYGILIFGSSLLLFRDQAISINQQVVYLVFALVLAFTFQPLRRFFDRITKAVFYRDSYETQTILDAVSSKLVSAVSVSRVLSDALNPVNAAIKPIFASVVLNKEDVKDFRFGKKGQAPKSAQLLQQTAIPAVLMVETTEEQKMDSTLRALREEGVAMVAQLQTSKERVGLIFFGHKENGGLYTQQDIDLVRIVADELAVAMQNALRFEEISRFNERLTKEIAEATAQLRDTNRKLKKLDEIKDEFISMASHQLRTPLTSVKGYISMVLEGDAGPVGAQQKQLLEEAFTSAQRMVYLIGDFLNVSRLQTGKFVIEWKPTNLATVVKEEVDQLRETATRHHIKLQFDPPSSFPVLQLDENKMRQVIMNFIDNAIFYTRPGGTVKVVLLAVASDVRLEVHDTGIGVPEEERHKLFTKFFRADNARKVRPDGTGIGLFMAKKVVAAHGGSVIFESQEGKGSIFGFTLPKELGTTQQSVDRSAS